MKSQNVIIRPFEERDRKSIRTISKKTGQKVNPTWTFFEDEEIIPMFYADYYMDYEPESCFVAEIHGRVVGYLICCKDTRQKIRVLWRRIYPRVCIRILWKILSFQYRKKQTYQTLWWIISRSWRESFRIPLDEYPGHAHFNVEEEYRTHGLGLKLNHIFRRHRLEKGIWGMHLIIHEVEGHNELANFLIQKRGFKIVSIKRSTVWEKVTGKKWYAKLLVHKLSPNSEVDHNAS